MPVAKPTDYMPAGPPTEFWTPEPDQERRQRGIMAGFERESLTTSLIQGRTDRDQFALAGVEDPSYRWADDIEGYEQFADYLSMSLNAEEMRLRKQVIDRNLQRQQEIEAAGGWGTVGQVLGYGLDPVTVLTLFAPLGYGLRAGSFTRGAVVGGGTLAAEVGAVEAGLHYGDPTRTAMESAFNVGGAALLGGLLGGAVHGLAARSFRQVEQRLVDDLLDLPKVTSKGTDAKWDFVTRLEDMKVGLRELPDAAGTLARIAEFEKQGLDPQVIVKAIEQNIPPDKVIVEDIAALRKAVEEQSAIIEANMGRPSTAGAAGVDDALVLARGGAVGALAKLTPAGRMALLKVQEAQALGMRLFENTFRFMSRRTGMPEAAPLSVESGMRTWDARMGEARVGISHYHRQQKQRAQQQGEKPLSRDEFRNEVGRAMRRGDQHPIPEVAAAAKLIRDRVYNPLFREGIKARLFDPYVRALARKEGQDRYDVLAKQRKDWLAMQKRDIRRDAAQARKEAMAATSLRELNVARDRMLGEVEQFYAARLDELKQEQAAELAYRLNEIEELTTIQREGIKAEIKVATESKVAELKQRRAAREENIRKLFDDVYPKIFATQGKNYYTKMIESFRAKARQNLREKLAAISKDDKAARAAAEKEAEREFRVVVRAFNRQEREALREVKKAARIDRRETLKERNAMIKQINKDKLRDIEEAEAAWAMPKRGEFNEAVALAVLKDLPDEYITPLIRKTVEDVRAKLADDSHIGQYLNRMYNVGKMKQDNSFVDTVAAYIAREEGIPTAEARAAAQDAYNKILRISSGRVDAMEGFRVRVPGTAGVQKLRTLLVPDEVLEPWLMNDADMLANAYTRTVGPRVELSKLSQNYGEVNAWKFGDEMKAIEERYSELMANTSDPAARKALLKELEQFRADVNMGIEKAIGTWDLPAESSLASAKLAAYIKTMNFLSMMGNMTIASIADAAQPIAIMGFAKSYGTMAKALGKGVAREALKMSRKELHKAGVALEYTLPLIQRLPIEHGEVMVDKYTQAMGTVFTHAVGQSTWNTAMKTFAGIMVQDRMFDVIQRLAPKMDAGTLSKAELQDLADLAQFGISNDMVRVIARQPVENLRGLKMADTEKWTDPFAVAAFQNALTKMANTLVITPGHGDKFRWVRGPWKNLIVQFKSFSMAAINKALIPFIQDPRAMRQTQGFAASMVFALAVMELRALSTGRTEQLRELYEEREGYELFRQAMAQTALGTLFTEVENLAVGGLLGAGESVNRYTSPTFLGAVGGPTVGRVEDIYNVLRSAMDTDREFSGADVRKIRRMWPYQNAAYMRYLFDQMEEAVVEAADLKPRK